ncbi:MAG: serine/threonine protein kinase [Ideonella sp.]|nr:serine/threonine protein kinase [Ideonella sp.]MBL0151543.1 serine/threonine protein kinase [Ideonella sp.]
MDTGFGRITHLGRYQIVRVLGRGSMGVVYEALDPRLNRPVAIKTILKGHLMDETLAVEYTQRFQTEAQAVGRLAHPNIVTLHDFGEEGEIAYIVMEFIRGRELASHFEAGDYFDLPTAVRIMCELLEALAFAHERGIVHRDIKPANVMIDEDGRVKLTDFGVARVSDGNSDRTQPGTMVGTPSYMSPEQILGLSVGSRTDLFAAGVVLYQFLAHDKPFKGAGPWDVQRKIVNDVAVPPSKVNPAAPRVFDAIVAKALAKQPEQRYADAASFAADLRSALAKVPAQAATMDLPLDMAPDPTQAPSAASAAPPASGHRTRRRIIAGLGGAGLILATGLWIALRAPIGVRPLPTPSSTPAAASMPASAPIAAASAASPLQQAPVPVPVPTPAPAPARATAPATGASPAMSAPTPERAPLSTPNTIPHSKDAIASNPMDPRPPVRQNGSAPVPRAATEPAPAARRKADPRCADLLQQAQLGESLSPESLAYLRKECR